MLIEVGAQKTQSFSPLNQQMWLETQSPKPVILISPKLKKRKN
jgi:hypothetical protein